MKKTNKINPMGLKGNQINERMKSLMGISTINENKSTSVVELTKMGPDGNVYGIVRENHEYYIKTTTKKNNLVAEDFNYIGGLMNKHSEGYPSYAKATKHLNLKFKSLAEAHNADSNINILENDNLVKEEGIAGMSDYKGNGFSGAGNLEGNTPMGDTGGDNPEDITSMGNLVSYSKGGSRKLSKGNGQDYSFVLTDNDEQIEYYYTTNGRGGVKCVGQDEIDEFDDALNESGIAGMSDFKGNGFSGAGNLEGNTPMHEEELTEEEQAVEDMMEGDDPENETKGDEDYKDYVDSLQETKKLSISRALENMDEIIDSLTEGKSKKKVYTIK